MLVPVEIIENIVSRDMALRYLQFDIKVGFHVDILKLNLKLGRNLFSSMVTMRQIVFSVAINNCRKSILGDIFGYVFT